MPCWARATNPDPYGKFIRPKASGEVEAGILRFKVLWLAEALSVAPRSTAGRMTEPPIALTALARAWRCVEVSERASPA